MVTAAELQADQFKPVEWCNLTWALATFSQGKAAPLRSAPVTVSFSRTLRLECEVSKFHFLQEQCQDPVSHMHFKGTPCRATARDALARLAPDILPSVDSCCGRDCSRLLWAYRRAGVLAEKCQALVFALIGRCSRISAEISARDAATVLWAAGSFRSAHDFPVAATRAVIKVLPACVHSADWSCGWLRRDHSS
jgi:hypothetical protein